MNNKSDWVLIGLLSLCTAFFLGGCSDMLLFNPKGPIGDSERFVIIVAIALMLIVVIPVSIMVFLFPGKYRSTNPKATYMPKWSRSAKIEWVIWLVPAVIITVLATLIWHFTFRLDPYKPIDTGVKPINIEVVSMDWKWLFIYPDRHIAAVNQLVFPAGVPLSFKITSDTVMTSFFIPQLGSQIYAMAGMQTRLHLLADEPGTYIGQNQQFSGRGYADMTFKAIAVSPKEYEVWVQKVKQSPDTLNLARYEELEKPSTGYPVSLFSSVEPDLFDRIIHKYAKTVNMNPGVINKESDTTHFKSDVLEGS
jgi:cytochrome o ubiquinol oxidase subunit II